MTHICVSELTIIGCGAWSAPSHYLNQWWNIVNSTLRNKLQWSFNRNSNIFIQENALEDVVCEMASILSRPQCVNRYQDWPVNLTTPQEEAEWCGEIHKSLVRPKSRNQFLLHHDNLQLIKKKTIAVRVNPRKFPETVQVPCHCFQGVRWPFFSKNHWFHLTTIVIESIKTTFMEDVSTRVLEKIKNISEGKTEKWSDISRHI